MKAATALFLVPVRSKRMNPNWHSSYGLSPSSFWPNSPLPISSVFRSFQHFHSYVCDVRGYLKVTERRVSFGARGRCIRRITGTALHVICHFRCISLSVSIKCPWKARRCLCLLVTFHRCCTCLPFSLSISYLFFFRIYHKFLISFEIIKSLSFMTEKKILIQFSLRI